MLKKMILMLLTVSMLITGFAACSSGSDTGNKGDDAKTSGISSGEDQTKKDDFSEEVKITMNVLYTEKNNIDRRYDFLRKKFNINFDLIACSLNDIKEKSRVWIASGDMPEVMWTNMELLNASELKDWAKSGMIKELPDMSAYTNLKTIQDGIPSYKDLAVDGKNYFWLGGRGLEKLKGYAPEVYLYRKDWAKQLGMDKEEFTWDEMIALAKAFAEKDPGHNGSGKTIGMAAIAWAYPACSGLDRISPQWDSFVKKDGQYVWGGALPETLEGVKEAKKLFDENVFWKEQSIAKTFDGPSQFQAGQVGILYHNLFSNNVLTTVDGMEKAIPGIKIDDAVGIMKLKSPDGTYFNKEIDEWWGTTSFRSDINEKKMERFLAMQDWLNSEEGLTLRTYGLEGTDYNKNGDNYEMLWDRNTSGGFISPYAPESDRILNMFQLTESANYTLPTVPDSAKGLMQQVLGSFDVPNPTVKIDDRKLKTYSAPNKDKYNIAEETRTKIIELIISSKNIEKDYNAWCDSMRPKIDPILKELNEGLK